MHNRPGPRGSILRILVYAIVCTLFCLSSTAHAAPRVVHVVVALCDNLNQGIVPVPAGIGNGQDPASNLYWGARYGVKTFLTKQKEWTVVARDTSPTFPVLERIVFKHRTHDLYIVADAYDGREIKQSIVDFLQYTAGAAPVNVQLAAGVISDAAVEVDTNTVTLNAGGGAGLIIYVGHNGLMDFGLDAIPEKVNDAERYAAVFACMSKQYFTPLLHTTGATPLILTTNLMCPEAYTTNALILSWSKGDDRETIRRSVAAAYSTYQKCSLKASLGLLVTE